MIPLTTMPSCGEDSTPIHHYPRRRLVPEHVGAGIGSYMSPATCAALPYGHQVIIRGSPRHGQYTTAAACAAPAQDYLMASPFRRDQVCQVAEGGDGGADWKDACWRVLTCGGLCSGSAAEADGGGKRRSQALMVDIVSRVLFPIMFIIFNIIYWPIYLM